MRVRTGVALLVGALSAFAVATVGLIVWLLASEAGTAWIIARVEAQLPLRITLGELHGTLLRGLVLRDLVIETDYDRMEIGEATLALDLGDLLDGTLAAERLTVSTLSYRRGEPLANRAPRGAVVVPIRILVREGSIQQVTLVRAGEETVLGPVAFTAEAAGSRIVAEDVSGSGLGFDVKGRGELLLDAELAMDGDFEWSTTRNDRSYAGAGRAQGVWPQIAFHQDIRLPVALVVDGTASFGPTPTVELEASWQELAWPGFALARSPQGTVRMNGWLESYEFAGGGAVIVDGMAADVVASGSGTLTDLQFDALRLTGEHGEIDAAGRLDFAPLSWALDVETVDLNPEVRLPDWPGALDLNGRLSGSTAPAFAFALRDMSVTGELRGRPIAANGNVEFRSPNRWQLEDLTVSMAENQLSLSGSLGETVALDVTLDARRLDQLASNVAGSLQVAGRVGGTLAEPTLTGVASGQELRYGELAAGSFSASGEIVADEARSIALDLNAEALTVFGRQLSSISATIDGTAARHVAEANVVADLGSARLRAGGSWIDGAWSGEITDLQLVEPTLGAWQLTRAARAGFSRGRIELERSCLVQGDAELCGSARIGTDSDALELELTAFDLANLAAVLPSDLSIAGVYDARLSLAGPLPRPAGTFETHGTGTVVTIRELDEPTLEIPIDVIGLRGELTAAGELQVEAGLEGANGARVDIDGTVSRLWNEDRELSASISGRWAELGVLSLLSPDVGEVSGTATIDLELEGRPRSPDIRGRAQWLDGRVQVPRWGLIVENIDAQVSSPNGSELLLQASGTAGDGRLELTGVTQVDPDAGWPTDLRVFGNGLQAVRLPEADILVSPALEIHAALPDIDVTGAFLIPHGRLRLEELPPQAVRPSADAVVHGVDRPVESHPLNMHADIRVGLGDDVRYTGAGLDVALLGAMNLVYDSGRNAVASGAVTLSGQYQAYGQMLEIENGQLLFTGPVENPNLDVRAIRRIESTATTDVQLNGAAEAITVGVQLSGTVEAPVTRVFSEPAMSEADALSYLLFGRPLSASGDEETATLETAAFAMGLQQALPAIQRVGETLGLDELSVQATTADTGELMAGKRISPRVYIRYTYGLFNRIGGLLMRFDLNDRYSLETRSGDYRSMDLIYTRERD